MSLRLNIDVVTQEDCDKGVAVLTNIRTFLPTEAQLYDYESWVDNSGVRACECGPEKVTARNAEIEQSVGDNTASPFMIEDCQFRGKEQPVYEDDPEAVEEDESVVDDLSAAFEQTFELPNSGLAVAFREIVDNTPHQVISANDARAAEQALMTEAVAVKRGRGRPKKNTGSVEQVVVSEPVSEPEPEDFMGLISQVESKFTPTTQDAPDLDIMAMLGGETIETEKPVIRDGDRYMSMDHESLYQEVRKRSGDDIRAPALGVVLREVVQRNKKIDSVYKFTDTMLRDLLRIADNGAMRDISTTELNNALISAWRERIV
jgi:hypothetical protein